MLVLPPLVKGSCQNRRGAEGLGVKKWQQSWWQLLQTFSSLEVCNRAYIRRLLAVIFNHTESPNGEGWKGPLGIT